jgi:hypothetical protein
MTTPGSVFGFLVGRRNRWWQREGDGCSSLGSGLVIWKFIPGKAWRVLASCGTEATEPERHIAMSLVDQDVETKDSNPRWVDAARFLRLSQPDPTRMAGSPREPGRLKIAPLTGRRLLTNDRGHMHVWENDLGGGSTKANTYVHRILIRQIHRVYKVLDIGFDGLPWLPLRDPTYPRGLQCLEVGGVYIWKRTPYVFSSFLRTPSLELVVGS